MENVPTVQAPRRELLPVATDWGIMLQMADALYKSGLLPLHIKSTQAALAIIQKGIELGVPPMYALSNIVVVQGKPGANAELMLALIYRDHGDNAVEFAETTPHACVISYRRRGWPSPRTYSFSIEDAKQAGLIKQGPWTTYPAAMLRARCISAVARMAFPDSIGGMYSAEELGTQVRVIDGIVEVGTEPVLVEAAEPRQLYSGTTTGTTTGEVLPLAKPRRAPKYIAPAFDEPASVPQMEALQVAAEYLGMELDMPDEVTSGWVETTLTDLRTQAQKKVAGGKA